MSAVDLRDRYLQLIADALTLTLWDARDGSLDQPDPSEQSVARGRQRLATPGAHRGEFPAVRPARGYLIVDDYALEPCAQAVNDFRGRNGITDPTAVIDWAGIYWQKLRT